MLEEKDADVDLRSRPKVSPVVTEEDGTVVLAVPDDTSDGLIDSTGRLLAVPLTPRQILQWGEEELTLFTR